MIVLLRANLRFDPSNAGNIQLGDGGFTARLPVFCAKAMAGRPAIPQKSRRVARDLCFALSYQLIHGKAPGKPAGKGFPGGAGRLRSWHADESEDYVPATGS
jgi:hypothetical protein